MNRARTLGSWLAIMLVVALFPLLGGELAGAADPIALSLDQSTNLVDGQAITITGTGPPSEQLALAQCRPEPLACDTQGPTSTFILTKVADDGTIRVETTARAILHTLEGDVDCTVAPSTCVLRVGVGSPYVVTDFPLSFQIAVVARPRLTG